MRSSVKQLSDLRTTHSDNSEKLGYSVMHTGIHNADGGHPVECSYGVHIPVSSPPSCSHYSNCARAGAPFCPVNSR